MGNLTRDPEIKYTPKGTAVANFGLAINRNYTTESGEKREEVTFVECEAWTRTAEVIGEFCKKGQALFLEGRLQLDTWDDKATGQKRSKLKVVAERVEFLGARESGGEQSGTESQPRRQSATRPPRPPADPDLDVQADDVPF